jgi:hypothetical protein
MYTINLVAHGRHLALTSYGCFLSALQTVLTTLGLLDKPMAFAIVMEFLRAGGDETTFQERVFLYLIMCLLLAQKRYVSCPTSAMLFCHSSSVYATN